MSRTGLFAPVCLMLIAAVALCGCGKAKEVGQAVSVARDLRDGEATIKTDDGEAKMKIEEDGESVTITSTDKEGKETVTWGSDAVDADKLGIELYPGAEPTGTGGTSSGSEGDISTVTLSTGDGFDKVAKFYKDKYPDADKQEVSAGGMKMLTLAVSAEPDLKHIMVQEQEGEGTVLITLVRQQAPE